MVNRNVFLNRLRCTVSEYWVLMLTPFLLLGPILLRGQALFWGTPGLQFVPWWQAAYDSLRQGVLPLWNPLNGLGAPLLANYQTAFLYPPNWLLLILAALAGPESSAAAIAWGYTLLAALHLAWCGLGMAWLLRRFSFGWLAQIIGGLAYSLSGYIVARLGFFSMVWVAAWLPWVIYFAEQLVRLLDGSARPWWKPRFLPGLAGCLAMQLLAGHAQLSWYTLLLTFAWVTAGALRYRISKESLRGLISAWLSLGMAAILAAGLAAAQLAPTFEYLQHSQRADAVGYEEALTYSFWPWRFLTIFAPDFFGSPADGDFWGYASYWEDHLYMGLLPVFLALSTLWIILCGPRRAGRAGSWGLVVFLWVVMLATFALALGRYAPFFPFLYHNVPTFSMFQAPARYLIWVTLALPILAAFGVERWQTPTGRGLYWSRLATAGAFAVTLGAGLAFVLMDDVRLTFVRASALAGLWALGFGLLTLSKSWAEEHGRAAIWQWAVIVWLLADLLLTGWKLNPVVDLSFYRGVGVSPPVSEGERVYLSRSEEYDLKFNRFLRFNDFAPVEEWSAMRVALLPNLNLLDGVALVNNFDPLVTEGYARWMDALETMHPDVRSAWLVWSGVGAEEHIDLRQPTGVRYDRLNGVERWHWYACARSAAGSAEAWQVFGEEHTAPPTAERAVILEGAPVTPQGNCLDPGDAVEITLIEEWPDRIKLMLSAPRDGWLELMSTWYPGWQVWIDGERAQTLRADGLFLAVQVPSGSHEIEWVYRPSGFYFGSLSSILVLFIIMIWMRAWKARDHQDAAEYNENTTKAQGDI